MRLTSRDYALLAIFAEHPGLGFQQLRDILKLRGMPDRRSIWAVSRLCRNRYLRSELLAPGYEEKLRYHVTDAGSTALREYEANPPKTWWERLGNWVNTLPRVIWDILGKT